MAAYYNEIDPYAAQWLRNLIKAGYIAPGDVDERSIVDVRANDVRGYTQCHFFAGIGGWSYALRLADWSDDRSVWTGSCPCQPFSQAGKRTEFSDNRDLWPAWFNLICQFSPPIIFGEQVAGATIWLDRVFDDLENEDYAVAAAILPACAVDAPHRRDRLWFVGNAIGSTRERNTGSILGTQTQEYRQDWAQHGDCLERSTNASEGIMADATGAGSLPGTQAGIHRGEEGTGTRYVKFERQGGGTLANTESIIGWRNIAQREAKGRTIDGWISSPDGFAALADTDRDHGQWWTGPLQVGWNAVAGKATAGGDFTGIKWRTKPGVPLLANGIPNRVERLRAYGNAIVPQVAAEFIKAAMSA